MKKTRRFAAIAAAVAMTACMAMPMAMTSFAATGDKTITITGWSTDDNNDQGTHSLVAYQIFSGKLDTTGKILTDIAFGDGVKGAELSAALVTASDTTGHILAGKFPQLKNDDDENIDYSAAEIAGIIATFTNDDKAIQAFADIVADNLTTTTSGSFTAASGESSATISGLAIGYYLVQDAVDSPTDNDTVNAGAKTRYILKLTEADAEIVIKASAPSVMKKVYEDTNTSTAAATIGTLTETDLKWNDVADYDIGEAVPFRLYGTMPSTLGDYDHYYYKFTDTLGTEFDMPTEVTVTVGNTTLKYSNGTDGNCRIVIDEDTHTITVSFEDIKAYAGVGTNTVVTVDYSAVLNDTAKIGLPGQENAVKLDYSSNPNEEYVPTTDDTTEDTPNDTGDTPEDKVIVFTYELDVTKVNKDDTTETLEGAEFILSNAAGKYATVTKDGIFDGWVDTQDAASVLTSGTDGTFKIIGLDDGIYTLTETKAPDGYSLPTTGFTADLAATTVNNQTWAFTPGAALTKLELNKTEQDTTNHGVAEMTIENSSGKTLPSTGGIGTTLFYVVGGTLVAGTGVTLIAKKRMKKED